MLTRVTDATVTRAGLWLTVSTGRWAMRFHVVDLPKWIAFYERGARRFGGVYARNYAPVLAALRSAKAEIAQAAET